MELNQIQNKYFKTTSFNLAVFLLCKNFKLISIEKTDNKRRAFVLKDEPQREHLVEVFNFGKENHREAMLDTRKVFTISKELKNKLYLESESI